MARLYNGQSVHCQLIVMTKFNLDSNSEAVQLSGTSSNGMNESRAAPHSNSAPADDDDEEAVDLEGQLNVNVF